MLAPAEAPRAGDAPQLAVWGPLAGLLDADVTDIFVNPDGSVWVDRGTGAHLVTGLHLAPREARDRLPRRLWWRTTVSVLDHWAAADDETKDEADVLRSRFLRELTRRLAEEDVFRGMLGPAHPRHRNHFHFDYGPWRYRIL